MSITIPDGPWPTAIVFGLLLLILFRGLIGRLLGWLCRSTISLALLTLWARSGILSSLCLGANVFNALTLGLLGLPGLGFLFLLRWATG